jgi:hypothetical protein
VNPQEPELLPREEKDPEFPLLRVQVPMEEMKNLFDSIAAFQKTSVVYAENFVIDSLKARDEARAVRASLKTTINQIEKKRLLVLKPLDEYRDGVMQVCKDVIAPLEHAIALYDQKGVDYNQKIKREEEEAKARILAQQRAEQERIEAERREREAEEQRLQAQEAERVAKVRAQAEKDAKKAKENDTARMQADEAAKAEVARIEQARAAREKAEADRQAEEKRKLEENQARMAQDMAKATVKTKGVKDIWVIEVVDESQVPRQFCSYEPRKAKVYCESGLSSEKDPLKIIPGLRCYVAMKSSGR